MERPPQQLGCLRERRRLGYSVGSRGHGRSSFVARWWRRRGAGRMNYRALHFAHETAVQAWNGLAWSTVKILTGAGHEAQGAALVASMERCDHTGRQWIVDASGAECIDC